jgi:hypothetical protein
MLLIIIKHAKVSNPTTAFYKPRYRRSNAENDFCGTATERTLHLTRRDRQQLLLHLRYRGATYGARLETVVQVPTGTSDLGPTLRNRLPFAVTIES